MPANYEVCEPCKAHLDAGEEVPLPLLAKLIKYRLMAIKTADIKRREVERKVSNVELVVFVTVWVQLGNH